MKIPKSTFRAIIILALSIVLVVLTRLVGFNVRADPSVATNHIGCSLKSDVDAIVCEYHATMNDLFNARIKRLVTIANNGTPQDLKNLVNLIAPPPLLNDEHGLPSKRAPCSVQTKGQEVSSTQNLSTYCLAQDAVTRYFTFRADMLAARKREKEKVIDQEYERLHDDSSVHFLKAPVANYGQNLADIDRQIEVARQSLDQALAAYNELQMALPLHLKYQQLIGELETYRDKVASIRKEIEQYPATFWGVTTTSCT